MAACRGVSNTFLTAESHLSHGEGYCMDTACYTHISVGNSGSVCAHIKHNVNPGTTSAQCRRKIIF